MYTILYSKCCCHTMPNAVDAFSAQMHIVLEELLGFLIDTLTSMTFILNFTVSHNRVKCTPQYCYGLESVQHFFSQTVWVLKYSRIPSCEMSHVCICELIKNHLHLSISYSAQNEILSKKRGVQKCRAASSPRHLM